MKKIEVIFRPEKLEPLKETLLEAGIKGATFYQVSGCGNQHGWIAYHRGSDVSGFGQTKRVIRLYKNQIEQTILTSGHFPFVRIL